jgi:hypothetical protein
MNFINLLDKVTPDFITLLSLFYFFISLKTIISRRSVIYSNRWIFACIIISFLPYLLRHLIAFFFPECRTDNPSSLLTSIVIFFILRDYLKGYSIVATSNSYLREALFASAKSLGFTLQERLSYFKIKETEAEFQVSVQEWIGQAQIKPKDKVSDATVSQLAAEMQKYFKNTPGKINYGFSYFFLFAVTSLIAFSVFLFTSKSNRAPINSILPVKTQ